MLVTRDPKRTTAAAASLLIRVVRRSAPLGLILAGAVACVPEYEYGEVPPRQQQNGPDVAHDAGTGTMIPPPPPTGNVPTWWQDVEPLIRNQCHLCHGASPLYGAPMPIATWEETHLPARSDPNKTVHEVIAERVQRDTGLPPMPPVANGHLTDAEIEIIRAWSAGGAPEGTRPVVDPKPDGSTPGGIDAGNTPPPDAGVDPGPDPEAPFEMIPVIAPGAAIRPGTTDLYGCFRTVIQTDQPLHAVEIAPILDQPEVLHHLLLFRDGGRNYPEQRTGFFCAADTVLQQDWELLHGWAPGGGTMELPAAAGVRLEQGDHIVIQIHYNNPSDATFIDNSGMMLKATRRLRPNDAAVLGVGTQSFSLPPGQTSVERSGTCQLSRPMHVFNYSPHMHLIGKAARMEKIDSSGTVTMLADVPNFGFESQVAYPASWDLVPGDSLRATCVWDTSGRTQNTGFGEGTEDEMCYMFIAHYPPFGEYSCGD